MIKKLAVLGIHGSSLRFLESFLINRTQKLKIHGLTSRAAPVRRGVPQGSVLDPILFNLYVWDLPRVVQWSKIVMYADDVQLVFRCKNFEINSTTRLQEDLTEISHWMNDNGLQINVKKTQALHIKNKDARSPRLNINDEEIQFGEVARDLGVYFDKELRFEQHISRCVRSARWKLFKIRSLIPFLTQERLRRLVQSCILYPMLYGSAVFGPRILVKDLRRLQIVQNYAVKVINGRKWRDHCSDLYLEMKWARIPQLIATKLTCLTHTAVSGALGEDLKKLFVKFDHSHGTRGNQTRLQLGTYRKEGFTSFRYTGAHYANMLPLPAKKETTQEFRKRFLQHLVENATSKNIFRKP